MHHNDNQLSSSSFSCPVAVVFPICRLYVLVLASLNINKMLQNVDLFSFGFVEFQMGAGDTRMRFALSRIYVLVLLCDVDGGTIAQ